MNEGECLVTFTGQTIGHWLDTLKGLRDEYGDKDAYFVFVEGFGPFSWTKDSPGYLGYLDYGELGDTKVDRNGEFVQPVTLRFCVESETPHTLSQLIKIFGDWYHVFSLQANVVPFNRHDSDEVFAPVGIAKTDDGYEIQLGWGENEDDWEGGGGGG